jgi:hypothetical protein
MKIAFYLITFYGALAYLVTTWGEGVIEKYRATHSRRET